MFHLKKEMKVLSPLHRRGEPRISGRSKGRGFIFLSLSLASLLLPLSMSHAQIYKWTDKDGHVNYSSCPPLDCKFNMIPEPAKPTDAQVREARERAERERQTLSSFESIRITRELGPMLLSAIEHGDPSTMLELLDRGVSPDFADYAGRTALMYSAINGQVRVITRTLLNRGANVNRTSNDGTTALMAAAIFGNPEGVQMLLESGARIDARDTAGRSALDWARTRLINAPPDRSVFPNVPIRNVYGDFSFCTKAEVIEVVSLLEKAGAQ